MQAHYLGYLDTMGARFLPYVIADATAITKEMAAHYSEAVVARHGGSQSGVELLEKPFTSDALLSHVRRVLSR